MGKESRGLWSPQCCINAVTAAVATDLLMLATKMMNNNK